MWVWVYDMKICLCTCELEIGFISNAQIHVELTLYPQVQQIQELSATVHKLCYHRVLQDAAV